ALERQPDQWPAYLDDACAGNAELRAQVNELLEAHQAMGSIHGDPSNATAVHPSRLAERPGMYTRIRSRSPWRRAAGSLQQLFRLKCRSGKRGFIRQRKSRFLLPFHVGRETMLRSTDVRRARLCIFAPRHERPGFTLVELLVVIAII